MWLGLPNPKTCRDPQKFHDAIVGMQQVIFCGFGELSEDEQREVVEYLMDSSHYAALRTAKSRQYAESVMAAHAAGIPYAEVVVGAKGGAGAGPASSSFGGGGGGGGGGGVGGGRLVPMGPGSGAGGGSSSTALKAGGFRFEMPRPGLNGAEPGQFEGKRFVLTGLFPEVGGGAGLNLGKDRVKAMIESFGGTVTGSVSGKTDFVVVGKEPGAGKTSQANAKGVPLVDLKALKVKLETPGLMLEGAAPPVIAEYSRGYETKNKESNSVALRLGLPVAPKKIAETAAPRPPKQPKPKAAPKAKAKAKAKAKGKGKKRKADDSSDEDEENDNDEDEDEEDEFVRGEKAEAAAAAADDMEIRITCDLCTADCSAMSWLITNNDSDVCVNCFQASDNPPVGKPYGVLCKNGKPLKKQPKAGSAAPKAEPEAEPKAKGKGKGKANKRVKAIAE